MRDEQLAELMAEAVAREFARYGAGVEVHRFLVDGKYIRVVVEREIEEMWQQWNQSQVALPQSSG